MDKATADRSQFVNPERQNYSTNTDGGRQSLIDRPLNSASNSTYIRFSVFYR